MGNSVGEKCSECGQTIKVKRNPTCNKCGVECAWVQHTNGKFALVELESWNGQDFYDYRSHMLHNKVCTGDDDAGRGSDRGRSNASQARR